ncbi:hypothetical protein LINGRAHAP2_LOCUS29906 [Linum grandiflorum]
MDSQLPKEIEQKIVEEHLFSFDQLVSFSGVCKSWRSFAKDHYYNNLLRSFPGILVTKTLCPNAPFCQEHFYHEENRDYFTNFTSDHQFLTISTIFNSVTPPPQQQLVWSSQTAGMMMLPAPHKSWEAADLERCHCIASKDGWLVLLEDHQPEEDRPPCRDTVRVRIFVFNPITGASILLPPLPTKLPPQRYGPSDNIAHAILSSSPEKHKDCHVILFVSPPFCSSTISWCKVSGGSWNEWIDCIPGKIKSACYIGAKLYVLSRDYVNVIVNVIENLLDDEVVATRPPHMVTLIPFPRDAVPHNYTWPTLFHVTELNRQLIVVHKYENLVTVYKLVATSNCWKEVRSLDGHALFLGAHQCFCVPVKNNNNGIIKADHIYYLNNSCGHCEWRHTPWNFHRSHVPEWGACGIFSLEDQQLVARSHLPPGMANMADVANNYEDYTWLVPMPWDIHKQEEQLASNQIMLNHKIDHDNTFKLPYKAKVIKNNNRLCRQQLASDRIIPLSQEFRASIIRDIHKHSNMKKNMSLKQEEQLAGNRIMLDHKIDDNTFKLPYKSKVINNNSRLCPQQLASNRIIPCHKSFQLLLLGD